MYTLLCSLCEGSSAQLQHGNWLGYIGFAVVVVMLINSEVTKAKAKKAKKD